MDPMDVMNVGFWSIFLNNISQQWAFCGLFYQYQTLQLLSVVKEY